MIEELDVIALTHPLPEHGLAEGERGTVVMVQGNHEAYEVEFMEGDTWYTKALVTLWPDDVRLVWKLPANIAAATA